MKLKSFLLSFVSGMLLIFATVLPCGATVVTFDDLSETGSGTSYFGLNYRGLSWTNVSVNNAILFTNILPHLFSGSPSNGLSGNYYGMVSPSNVASFFPGSEIDSFSSFNFLSAYLTGFWNSNLNVEVQGFSGSTLLYDTTVVVSATSPTLFTFDYLNIDDIRFNSFGGVPVFCSECGGVFVMDNFEFEFVPEPSAFLLTAAGALSLMAFLRRRKS